MITPKAVLREFSSYGGSGCGVPASTAAALTPPPPPPLVSPTASSARPHHTLHEVIRISRNEKTSVRSGHNACRRVWSGCRTNKPPQEQAAVLEADWKCKVGLTCSSRRATMSSADCFASMNVSPRSRRMRLESKAGGGPLSARSRSRLPGREEHHHIMPR